ncbi:NAD(P)/FAD-dependent oxidoreductase [Crateriforma conspicua]|uniref:Protoporphyrinogen oxidase n=1 Tax=Crateriforma conspicua TaxID=2527996 RepID=A0A5C5YA46_9PLAN|nr:NAD(P)/FAD-dependent oxidoreductase [Crateriforma conspicua]TWT72547.1 Protoporphyrinogen oxidase [Crateriforma conspicua]
MKTHYNTLIIGGGLAGLSCATHLANHGVDFSILEASERPGGRLRTDVIDGFTLDHGFQVLLTAYPACRELLDYDALRLRPFEPGALIRQQGQFSVLGDPWRRPTQAIATLTNPVGTLGDKLRVAKLRSSSRRGTLDRLYQRPATSTIDRLNRAGFSASMIDQFFRPFLGGVFLDETLQTSSRMLEFVFRMFAEGDIAIPAEGMAAIPRQLSDQLPQGTLRFSHTVVDLARQDGKYRIGLSDGSALTSDRVAVAVESNAAAALLGDASMETPWSGTTNFYFTTDQTPDRRKLLMLRGDESGPIQSAVVISNVAPEYAPPGKALISVSVDSADMDPETGDTEATESQVRDQLESWFGGEARRWNCLHVYRVPFGLPVMDLDPVVQPTTVRRLGDADVPAGTLVRCGDYLETPSIQGAMNSGLRAAKELRKEPRP